MTLRTRHLLWLTMLLLVIAAAHTLRLRGLEMNPDETWSIWQTFGTPGEIIERTPYDWTPLYYLSLGGWRLLVGIHPVALRFLSVLLSLLGAAFAYAAARRLAGHRGGVLGMLIYAALAYSVFISGYVRPYALAHALVPLGFWLVLRYFEPNVKQRAARRDQRWIDYVLLVMVLTVSFYTTLVAPIAIAFFGLFTLVRYGVRRALLLWTPVAVAFIAFSMPIIVPRLTLVSQRVSALAPLPAFGEAMAGILREYAGDVWYVWAVLLVSGVFAALARRGDSARLRQGYGRALLGLALWGFGGLVVMYIANPVLGFFNPSYAFWTLTGMALFGGLALAALPRLPVVAVTAVLVVLMFIPPPESTTRNYAPPGVSVFSWLREPSHYHGGDVVLLDPNFDCLAAYELDYFTRAFFPDGLPFVVSPEGYRRVWYATNVNTQDTAFAERVAQDRQAGIFVGPPTCLWRLYEAPPDVEGMLFENGMRFHGVDVLDSKTGTPITTPIAAREGETVRVRLWWSVDAPVPLDYSVGVYVLDAGGAMIAQTDSAPQVNVTDATAAAETSRWQPGRYYVEERELLLPNPLLMGSYRLVLTVYQWWDNARIAAPGVDDAMLLPLLPIDVMSW